MSRFEKHRDDGFLCIDITSGNLLEQLYLKGVVLISDNSKSEIPIRVLFVHPNQREKAISVVQEILNQRYQDDRQLLVEKNQLEDAVAIGMLSKDKNYKHFLPIFSSLDRLARRKIKFSVVINPTSFYGFDIYVERSAVKPHKQITILDN